MAEVKAVLWDLGNTLLDWEPARLYRQLMDSDDAVEEFLSGICTMAWHTEHDRGVTMAENRKALIAAHPDKAHLIEAWDTGWDEMFYGWLPGMEQLVADLEAAAVPQYALSNMPAEKWAPIKRMFPPLGRFLKPVISGDEGCVKPDPRIYQITVNRIDHAPQETVFVDDRADNIAASIEFGFHGIQFQSAEDTRARMKALGLPV
jgi:FMN phosphatase YigB (HAD superfamily)